MKSVLLLWFSAFYATLTTSQYVDDLERKLAVNRDTYLSGPRTPAAQKSALDYFDQQWKWLQSSDGCGSRLLGQAGVVCITDRQRTGRWPWETYYRDPIVTGHF